jgi:hypothetical protein
MLRYISAKFFLSCDPSLMLKKTKPVILAAFHFTDNLLLVALFAVTVRNNRMSASRRKK